MTYLDGIIWAEEHGYIIKEQAGPLKSFSVEVGGICGISIDRTGLNTREAKTALYHEIGHCETRSFYNELFHVSSRKKHENRADKWAIKKLIPEDELKDAVSEGHTEIWDLAEYFGVTEDFMRKAICWYTHGNLATELYF